MGCRISASAGHLYSVTIAGGDLASAKTAGRGRERCGLDGDKPSGEVSAAPLDQPIRAAEPAMSGSPTITLPCRFTDTGTPVAFQFVGGSSRGRDAGARRLRLSDGHRLAPPASGAAN